MIDNGQMGATESDLLTAETLRRQSSSVTMHHAVYLVTILSPGPTLTCLIQKSLRNLDFYSENSLPYIENKGPIPIYLGHCDRTNS
jgi:hypothetical protein